MSNNETKKCNQCGNRLPLNADYFHRHSYYRDGFRSVCKQCYQNTVIKANTDESILKRCSSCQKEFPATAEYFYRSKIGKYGLMTVCKPCQSKIHKAKNNPVNVTHTIKKVCRKCGKELPATLEYFHREKAGLYGVRSVCKKCICERLRQNRNTDEFRKKSREKIRKNEKIRLSRNIATSIRNSISAGKNGRHWESMVDFSLEQLKKHIERKFKTGMSWNNYGEWHIDHIIPVSVYNFDTPEHIDFKRCWSLKNLQPMWAKENISKSNKIKKHFQPSLSLSFGGQ